jgi:hypothetical protein
MNHKRFLLIILFILLAGITFLIFQNKNRGSLNTKELPVAQGTDPAQIQYLAFQIFISGPDGSMRLQNVPPPDQSIAEAVDNIIRTIGTVGSKNRKLGFIPGPLTFDNTDDEIRTIIRNSFSVAINRNIAVGFHIDDSMFWGRLSELNTIENIEWLDWGKTPNTGRRLDWSSKPTKIMPQLCFNSPAVKTVVQKRATLIGQEITAGMQKLQAADKEHLFLGVIAGSETQIGQDFDTGKQLGYCALTNLGYSSAHPPANIDAVRANIVKEFIDLWSQSLIVAGVPTTKIFSHTAFISRALYDASNSPQKMNPQTYLQTIHFSPPDIAFSPYHYPGFSTYPQSGHLEEIQAERAKNGNPPWASSEGTAIDPSDAEKGGTGISMEGYLGNLYNHGAILVNIFGWGVGRQLPFLNPFRKIAESDSSIKVYQKFLHGEHLLEDPSLGNTPPAKFIIKIEVIEEF